MKYMTDGIADPDRTAPEVLRREGNAHYPAKRYYIRKFPVRQVPFVIMYGEGIAVRCRDPFSGVPRHVGHLRTDFARGV